MTQHIAVVTGGSRGLGKNAALEAGGERNRHYPDLQ